MQEQVKIAEQKFLDLKNQRLKSFLSVSEQSLRLSATDYVRLAQACYQEKYGSSIPAETLIDHDGVWYDDPNDGAATFVTWGTKWGAGSPYTAGPDIPGPALPGGEVTWGLMPDGVDNSLEGSYSNNVSITSLPTYEPCFINEIIQAFDAWEAMANISFKQVTDDGLPFNIGKQADIRIGAHTFDGSSGTLAHGYYPPPNGDTSAGDIHIDVAENWVCEDLGPGIDIGIVMLHEIGHAIGLNHVSLPPTAMMNPTYNPAIDTLQPDDILGIESIYGRTSLACTVSTSMSNYTGTELVTISSMNLANNSESLLTTEWKVWLTPPSTLAQSIINVGAEGDLVLSAGFFGALGPIDLFQANLVAPGSYQLGCRLIHPVTGELQSEQITTFEIN